MIICGTAPLGLYTSASTAGTTYYTTATGVYTNQQLATQAALQQYLALQQAMQNVALQQAMRETIPTILRLGQSANIELPDGGRFVFQPDGSYRIEDDQAKITYKANRVREFNTFVNASDRLEDFVRWAGALGLTAEEVLRLPIKDFVMWLVTEAGLQDDCVRPEDLAQLKVVFRGHIHPRCRCGKLIPRRDAERGFMFCSGAHYDRYRKLRGIK